MNVQKSTLNLNVFSTKGINGKDAYELVKHVKNENGELLIKIRNSPYFIQVVAHDFNEYLGFLMGEMYDEFVDYENVTALAVASDMSFLDFPKEK